MSMRNQLPGQATPQEDLGRFGNQQRSLSKTLPLQNVGPEVRDYSQSYPTAVASDIATEISAHISATDPHPDLIDDLTETLSLGLTDELIISQGGTNRRVTLAQLFSATFGHLVTPQAGALTLGGLTPALKLGTVIAPTVGALTLTGKAATRNP